MSISLMSAVWKHSPYEGRKLLVLLAMADFANEDSGQCFPFISTLAAKARCSERLVHEAIAEFVRDGWIADRLDRWHNSTIWTLAVPQSKGAETAPHPAPQPPLGAVTDTSGVQSPSDITVIEPPSITDAVDEPLVTKAGAAPPSFSPPKELQYQHTWAPPPAAVTAVCNAATVLVPDEHLDHYLARCSELKKKPSGAEWVRWFMKDQNDRRAADRLAAQSSAPETDDSGVPLSWR